MSDCLIYKIGDIQDLLLLVQYIVGQRIICVLDLVVGWKAGIVFWKIGFVNR